MLKAFGEMKEWVDYNEICLRLNVKIIVLTLKSDSNVLRLQNVLMMNTFLSNPSSHNLRDSKYTDAQKYLTQVSKNFLL